MRTGHPIDEWMQPVRHIRHQCIQAAVDVDPAWRNAEAAAQVDFDTEGTIGGSIYAPIAPEPAYRGGHSVN